MVQPRLLPGRTSGTIRFGSGCRLLPGEHRGFHERLARARGTLARNQVGQLGSCLAPDKSVEQIVRRSLAKDIKAAATVEDAGAVVGSPRRPSASASSSPRPHRPLPSPRGRCSRLLFGHPRAHAGRPPCPPGSHSGRKLPILPGPGRRPGPSSSPQIIAETPAPAISASRIASWANFDALAGHPGGSGARSLPCVDCVPASCPPFGGQFNHKNVIGRQVPVALARHQHEIGSTDAPIPVGANGQAAATNASRSARLKQMRRRVSEVVAQRY